MKILLISSQLIKQSFFPIILLTVLIDLVQTSKYPYVVRIFRSDLQQCSGTLFLTNWVLTSALCVVNKMPKEIKVYAGDTEDKFIRKVKLISIHDFFQENPLSNDIALVKLSRPFEFPPVPIAMLVKNGLLTSQFFEVGNNTEAVFFNWEGNTPENRKLKINRHEVFKEPCVSDEFNQFICTRSIDNNLNSKTDNNGGPLLLKVNYLNEEQFLQFGVLSYTFRSESAHNWDNETAFFTEIEYVFTYIFYHFDWIRYTIKNHTTETEKLNTYLSIPEATARVPLSKIPYDSRRSEIEHGISGKISEDALNNLEKILAIRKHSTKSPFDLEDEEYNFDEFDVDRALRKL